MTESSLHTLIEFPKIQSLSSLVSNIKQLHKKELTLPIIEYTGKVKSHGTNFSIVFNSDGTFYTQSRGRVITPLQDNEGSSTWAYKNIEAIKKALNLCIHPDDPFINKDIVVYGEWCGGSIQSGVALSQLPKMFIIFAIRYNMQGIETWLGSDVVWQFNNLQKYIDPSINLYNVDLFKQYKLTIDFNNLHLVQNDIVQMTEEIEQQCPIGAYFGVSGIGEGMVLTCQESQYEFESYTWKSKGEKHSKSKVKTVGVVNIEVINETKELVNHLLYRNQLESKPAQAIRVLKEQGHSMDSNKDIKLFLDWLRDDIAKEDMSYILKSGLKPSNIMSFCFTEAKQYYKNYLETITFNN